MCRVNPFNGVKQYVSFEKTRLIVFWSKNPEPLIPFLPQLDDLNIHYLFQFTLNDYESEQLEPKLPALARRIETFKKLSNLIGRERVLWRFDPMILSEKINVHNLLEKIGNVGNCIYPYTSRLTISFLSLYPKVVKNLKRAQFASIDPDESVVKRVAEGLLDLSHRWGIEVVSCAENHDMSRYGIRAGRCIDPQLIIKLFSNDPSLIHFFEQYGKQDLFGLDYNTLGVRLKDSGQRKLCGCMISKDVGRYNTCAHNCIYCYANTSPDRVVIEDIFAAP